MRNMYRLLLVLALLAPVAAAHAEQDFAVGAGWFDFDHSQYDTANFFGEWRGDSFYYGFRPVVGGAVNTDGGTYVYGGLAYDWEVAPRWYIVPGVDVGYWHTGNSVDLGGPLEFHESLEADYKFDNGDRAGLQISHTSNADIYNRNPGAEGFMATFSFPIGK